MRGRAGQPVAIEHGPHFLRSMAVVAGKLDFAIADRGDFRQLALEVVLHHAADGVELQPDLVDLVITGCPGQLAGEHGGGGHRTQKVSSVHIRFLLASFD